VLLNNIILLVTLINFEPNPMLVNINNLKPYQHLLGGTTNHRSTTEGVQEYSDIYGDEDDEAMP
jgi:hypothetical protein